MNGICDSILRGEKPYYTNRRASEHLRDETQSQAGGGQAETQRHHLGRTYLLPAIIGRVSLIVLASGSDPVVSTGTAAAEIILAEPIATAPGRPAVPSFFSVPGTLTATT